MKPENLIRRRMGQGYIKPTVKEFQFLRKSEGLWEVKLVHLGLYGEEIESRPLASYKELLHETRFLKKDFCIRYTRCLA